jgi:hypothetical protein
MRRKRVGANPHVKHQFSLPKAMLKSLRKAEFRSAACDCATAIPRTAKLDWAIGIKMCQFKYVEQFLSTASDTLIGVIKSTDQGCAYAGGIADATTRPACDLTEPRDDLPTRKA